MVKQAYVVLGKYNIWYAFNLHKLPFECRKTVSYDGYDIIGNRKSESSKSFLPVP
jgi:hypothetical protein